MEDQTRRAEIQIGPARGDHASIAVLGRMHPQRVDDYWDGNWLVSPIEVVAGGFRAEVGAGLRADELVRFREELQRLQASLQGEAVLESMEGWLSLRIVATQLGGLQVSGRAVDQPGSGNSLSFTIGDLDQSHLPEIISALAQAELAFPVVGQPTRVDRQR